MLLINFRRSMNGLGNCNVGRWVGLSLVTLLPSWAGLGLNYDGLDFKNGPMSMFWLSGAKFCVLISCRSSNPLESSVNSKEISLTLAAVYFEERFLQK